MLDFQPYRESRVTLMQMAEALNRDDLRHLTEEMIDLQVQMLAGVEDPDVVFVPDDPEANDTFAGNQEDVSLPWTLGHVVVHATASSEEAAAHALVLARGLPVLGRSRYEVPWETVETVDFCRRRLNESRRMRLSMLDAWPDEPHLDNLYRAREDSPANNAIARFIGGLAHDDSHLDQIRKVAEQAKHARAGLP